MLATFTEGTCTCSLVPLIHVDINWLVTLFKKKKKKKKKKKEQIYMFSYVRCSQFCLCYPFPAKFDIYSPEINGLDMCHNYINQRLVLLDSMRHFLPLRLHVKKSKSQR